MRKTAYVLMVMLLAGVSMAGIEGGMKEVSFAVSLQNLKLVDSDDDGMYTFTGQLVNNYFANSHLSFGTTIRASISGQQDDNGDVQMDGTLFGMGRFDLYLASGSSPLIPFFGAHGGMVMFFYDSGDGESDSEVVVAYGGQGGFKVFPTERVSWNVEGDVTIFESAESEDETQVQVISLLVGFSYYF